VRNFETAQLIDKQINFIYDKCAKTTPMWGITSRNFDAIYSGKIDKL